MRIIFFGGPTFVVAVLKQLYTNFDLIAVVTSPDKLVGRSQVLTPSPVKKAFLELNPKGRVLIPKKISSKGASDEFIQQVKLLQPDLIVVASYARLIPDKVLDIPKYGCLNIHPSLLPKYRGVAPIPFALLNGDKMSGITIIKMDRLMDHGPVILQEDFVISDKDNFDILSNKMFQRGGELLVQIIPDFMSGKVILKEQDHTKATFTTFIKKEDGYFDIEHPTGVAQLDRMIRAYYPWPNVWTRWKGKIVKFYPEKIVQMEGKKAVKLTEFLRGYPDFPIKNLF